MSIEYTARVTLTEEEANRLAALIANDKFVRVPGGANGHLLFRIASTQPRETWPEDIELRVDGTQIYIAVHSATGPERASFIHLVETALASIGHGCSFEED